jgi:hypothetical protein
MTAGEATGLLWEYAGHFAMNAGLKRMEAGPANGNQDEARRFFQTAMRHYDEALVKRGDSIDNTVYRNLMLAHNRWRTSAEALRYGSAPRSGWRTTRRRGWCTPTCWPAEPAGRRAAGVRPGDGAQPGAAERERAEGDAAARGEPPQRRGRRGAAGPQRGDIQPDMVESLSQRMTQMGFQHAQANRFEQALPHFAAARDVGRSQRSIAMANFFHGYTLIRQGEPIIKDGNNAAAGRRAKPLFEQAKVLLEGAGAYSEQASNRAQLLQQVQQFIDVADALIRAGR